MFGLSPTAVDQFAQLRSVMAGSFGSILTLGIGPIVTASIVMQLLVGGKLIDLDLSLTEDKLRSFIESVTHLSWILKNSKDLPGKRKSKQKKNYM